VVSFSRNARLPLKLEKIEFVPFVKEILKDHQFTPNFDRIKFEVKEQNLKTFISDSTRLKIVLNNLISNSIKFHRFDSTEAPYIWIHLTTVQNGFTIRVKDNGKGISEDQINRIFEMFYRAEESVQGSGLGLYILKETVEKLGGTVKVNSEFNKGTIFIIQLPEKDLLVE
jgi:signal transduction histidine kinase